jgi:hypothetical protein
MLRSSRTGPTKIGSLTRASVVLVGALVALFGVIAGPLLGVFATSASAAGVASGYTAITPFRALGSSAAGFAVTAGTPANVSIVGNTNDPTGVPAGATAAVLNVTASSPTSAGYLELYPTGAAPATPTSNVNFVAGETVANLVTVPLSATGGVTVSNFAGTTAVDVDVEGYYSAAGAGLYNPVSPVRVAGTAAAGTPIAANTATAVTVTGGTIPASATAVVVNLTAAGGTAASYLSAYAAGATPATTSSLNFTAGETVANRDIVNVGTGGQIEVYNLAGSVNVDVDVDGYYGATGATFTALTAPVRVTDTRAGTALNGTSIASGGTETFNLATAASGIPATATSVAANFTVVPGAAPGYITVFPTGVTTAPTASDVNWPASSGPVANFTQADTAGTTAGSALVYNLDSGSPIDLVIDAFGYFTGGTSATSVGTVNELLATPPAAATPGTAIPENGADTETVTATVDSTTAPHGPVANDTVTFSVAPAAGCGTLAAATETTNASGVATDTYTAPAFSATDAASCTISISELDTAQSGSVTIAQTAPPQSIAVTGNANIPANGTSTDTLSATVSPGAPGETTANNDILTFATSGAAGVCGTIAASETTPATGTPTVTDTYTSTAVSGICTVTVTDTHGGSTAVNIDQTHVPALAAATVAFTTPTTNPDNVATGGAVFSISADVSISGAFVTGDPVTFFLSGDCGTNASGSEAPTAGGPPPVATYVTYTPSATAGTCTVTAQEAYTGATATLSIVQTAPAETVTVSPAAGTAVAIGTTASVTAAVAHDTATGTDTVSLAVSGTGCGTLASATEPVTLTAGAGTSTADTYTASSTVGVDCTITATTTTGGSGTTTLDQTA